MKKRLTMLSLGPGELQLLTISALDALKKCDVVCVPTKSEDLSFSKSITYKITQEALSYLGVSKRLIPVYSPMRFLASDWEAEADVILETAKKYDDVVYVTLGDAAIYSSVYYLLDFIQKKDPHLYNNTTVIAGVTSFSAASAKVKKPLCIGDERLEIEPINPRKKPLTTRILMRPKIGMDTSSLGDGDFYTFENMYLENEKIFQGKIKTVQKYMTLFIDFAKKEK
ncbi:MAG: precorrin-2 C(20)-methyltransferase [Epsilonproteobacteria bacterium]|nr:precorrin-2 C(20)-methyltransferase [Campylobacterota bacterium]